VVLDVTKDRWRSINGTLGVSRLVSAGDTPLPLPNGLVEALERRQRCGHELDLAAKFQLNQPVQFNEGPFSDVVGRIHQIDAKGRVQVLLEIMGRTVRVGISSAGLTPRFEAS